MKIKCDQCAPMMINGVFCHETGCENSHATAMRLKAWDAIQGIWRNLFKCVECGQEYFDRTNAEQCCAEEYAP